jgi:signal transduction histidine kinase
MRDSLSMTQPEFRAAFLANEQQERIHTGKVGSALVLFLMPTGILMDRVVYRDDWVFLMVLRLACSALAGVLWFLHTTAFGQKHYRRLGLPIALVPAFFISWMTCVVWDRNPHFLGSSPYYAGLNLVLLAVSVVVHWSVRESLLAVGSVLAMYSIVCLSKATHGQSPMIVNNFYFLVMTGITVITGNYFLNRLRFSEFSLRFELDRNKKTLEESNQKLKELDQIKSRFFANISHELRTPLTLLLAPLETLLHRFNRSLDEETRNLLATMHSNGMRLLKLINDLLDLVRLESGRMEVRREPLEVTEFVKGLASAARQVANDKRLRLETFVDPALGTVSGDRDKLEKVVLNLLFNALKFTPAGGRVDLRAEKRGEELVLLVADTGMGISEKNLPHVFDRFWQADGSSKRKYQGVGIGLALVKELVEIQDGRATVASQEGKGTTFTVRLPYQKADPTQLPRPEETPQTAPDATGGGTATSEEWLANLYRRAELFPALTPLQESLRPVETSRNRDLPTILVADDEPDMLRFLKSQLSAHYRVLEAVDGQQAIEKASQFLPDIILLDMMMPEKDGLQACREIREHTPTQSIPIILLTARADEETKLGALSAGASDFLTKPFSTTELHVRIKNLVESHQYQRKVSKQNQVLESTIEQLKETETQLVQTEKLASLGRMSAGIIHEINNPLNFATTGLFTLRNKGKYLAPEQQEEYADVLKDVEEGIKRVKTIVSDLRMFTHPDTESRDQVEVPEVVAAALRFLSNEWKDKVRIEQHLAEHQTVWANKNKLIHVLVNLLQNSIDALKGKSFMNEQPTIRIEGRLEAGKSIVVVRDNGGGIESEHLDKIFDPFYTTKDVGEGMGLGLAICYRIVQECEGRILVRTEPGKYCEFTLEFPAKGQESVDK